MLTRWVADHPHAHLPASAYGVAALGAGTAYQVMVRMIFRASGPESALARAVGPDLKGVSSLALYATAVGLAWLNAWIAYAICAFVALMWIVPDQRLGPQAGGSAGAL